MSRRAWSLLSPSLVKIGGAEIADPVLSGSENVDVDVAIRVFSAKGALAPRPSTSPSATAAGTWSSSRWKPVDRLACRIAEIAQYELVEIVRSLIAGAAESDQCLRQLDANVSHSRLGDPTFHPQPRFGTPRPSRSPKKPSGTGRSPCERRGRPAGSNTERKPGWASPWGFGGRPERDTDLASS